MYGPAINLAQPINRNSALGARVAAFYLPGLIGAKGNVLHDLSGNYHGTLTDMDPATDWQGPRGLSGHWGSLDFDGSNDQVVLSTATAFEPLEYQVFMWYRPANTTGYKMLLTKADGNGASANWGELRLNGTTVEVKATGAAVDVNIGTAAEANQWCFVSYNARYALDTALSVWHWSPANGWESAEVGTFTFDRVTTTKPWRIGARDDGGNWFSGQIASVWITTGYIENLSTGTEHAYRWFHESRAGFPNVLNRVKRRRVYAPAATPAFKAAWATQRSGHIIGGGVK